VEETPLSFRERKSKIPNSKSQINPNYQFPITRTIPFINLMFS
jgi:hypothetical protein